VSSDVVRGDLRSHVASALNFQTISKDVLYNLKFFHIWILSGFGGLVVSMLASGTKVCGFYPGRSCRIFQLKNPQHAFLRRGSVAVGPMLQICGM
jgi:hypothetical protein